MSKVIDVLIFWLHDPNIHVLPIAEEFHARGYSVKVFHEVELLPERASQGWEFTSPPFPMVRMRDKAHVIELLEEHKDCHHLFYGLMAYPLVNVASRRAAWHGYAHGFLQEKPDPRGKKGALRRFKYRMLSMLFRGSYLLSPGGVAYFRDRGYPAQKVHSLPYPVRAMPSGETTVRRDGPFRIGYVGLLEPRKNAGLLLDALHALDAESFEAKLAGVGSLKDTLQENAKGLPVEFLGAIPNREIPSFMAQLDVLVLPSLHDGYGMVVNEALTAGCRVVVSDMVGATEVVGGYPMVEVFRSNDCISLVSALRKAMAPGLVSSEERAKNRNFCQTLTAPAVVETIIGIMNSTEVKSARKTLLVLPSPPFTVHYREDFFEKLEEQYNVLYLVGNDLGTMRNSGRKNEIRIGWSRWPHQEAVLNPWEGIKAIWNLKPDAFLVYGNVNEPLVHLASTLFKLRRVPMFVWTQFHRAGSSKFRDFLKFHWTYIFNGILLYNDKERAEFIALGRNPEKICALNNGLKPIQEMRTASELECAWKNGEFVFCARLEPKNRTDILLDSYAEYVRNGGERRLVIIGAGALDEHIELADRLGIKGRTEFVGACHGADLIERLKHSFVMVHPYAVGLSLNTAFAMGVPLIAVAEEEHHMPEFWIFESGKTGWGVEHSSSASDVAKRIAEAMQCSDRISMEEYLVYSRNCYEANRRTGTDVMAGRLLPFLKKWL